MLSVLQRTVSAKYIVPIRAGVNSHFNSHEMQFANLLNISYMPWQKFSYWDLKTFSLDKKNVR